MISPNLTGCERIAGASAIGTGGECPTRLHWLDIGIFSVLLKHLDLRFMNINNQREKVRSSVFLIIFKFTLFK